MAKPGCPVISAYRQRKVCEILEEDRDYLTEVVQLESPDIVSVDEDLAFVWIVQADDELEDRALSGAVGPDYDLYNVPPR